MNQNKNYKKLCEFVDGLNILDKPFSAYFHSDDLNEETNVDDIYTILVGEDAFLVEPLNDSHEAMTYLMENDITLKKSIKVAQEYLFTEIDDWDSCFLARCLQMELKSQKFEAKQNDIQSFLDNLEW